MHQQFIMATLYILGGYNGARMNDVQFATLRGPLARARYSKLIDVGSDSLINSISFSASATNGITNLTYAVAPSATAMFETRTTIPNATSGTLYTIGLGTCARYAWVHLDLDDAYSVTINNGGMNGNEKDLLDFTINYSLLVGIGSSLRLTKNIPNIHLAWSVSPTATSYNVLRCTKGSSPCTPVVIDTPVTNSYDDSVLSDGNNYWYRIEAVNGSCVTP